MVYTVLSILCAEKVHIATVIKDTFKNLKGALKMLVKERGRESERERSKVVGEIICANLSCGTREEHMPMMMTGEIIFWVNRITLFTLLHLFLTEQ